MAIHPLLAIATPEIIIGVLVLGALLFGADKLPKLARSAGAAKKEFMMGQIEADEATIRISALGWTGSRFEPQRSWGFDRRGAG